MMGMTPLMFSFRGQVAVLAAHLLRPYTLGVLDGDAALCVGHDHHKDHSDQCQNYQNGQQDIELRLASRFLPVIRRAEVIQRTSWKRWRWSKGNTVADTLLPPQQSHTPSTLLFLLRMW